MTILSAQSIRRLCNTYNEPLIKPFIERTVINGKSCGLSACTYDCRIAEEFVILFPGKAVLVSTLEKFCLPNNVCGSVVDKSSYARIFVSAFNTHLDPGWSGYLTVELVNLGIDIVRYLRGQPVCQIKFEWLDEPTDSPYTGKYQDQEAGPQIARHEK